MPSITDKRNETALHILELITECDKYDSCRIKDLAEALTMVAVPTDFTVPYPGTCSGAPAEEEEPEVDYAPEVEAAPEPTPTPVPRVRRTQAQIRADEAAAAKKGLAKAPSAAPAAPAPVAAPAPTPEPPAAPEAPAALPEAISEPEVTPAEGDRLRAIIRDTYTARAKKFAAEGDPGNQKKLKYTEEFTKIVLSGGADTITNTDNNKLQGILDAVRKL